MAPVLQVFFKFYPRLTFYRFTGCASPKGRIYKEKKNPDKLCPQSMLHIKPQRCLPILLSSPFRTSRTPQKSQLYLNGSSAGTFLRLADFSTPSSHWLIANSIHTNTVPPPYCLVLNSGVNKAVTWYKPVFANAESL